MGFPTGGGGGRGAAPKPSLPNYGKLWSSYRTGEREIHERATRETATTRAKLGRAGASRSSITTMETERLEARDQELAGLQKGTEFSLLKEGFDIARGSKPSPYVGSPAKAGGGQNIGAYFSGLYGEPAAVPGAGQPVRAKGAALASGPATPAGRPDLSLPWLTEEEE